ncbi:hypothetical protein SEVIR_6G158100v4 [Setaria viridis]|uniref:Uncharacterized protein n=2 Tax=Setaria TaxID=4554 RepID=K3YJD0_SETIT|nr:uncharacterized protein LOC101781932 [Setaria italica]XP_034600374.1 uncharacterized protein LOC117861025 [Setaria viridis]RCV31127.1 hypothetical protein SETIT_6G151800v2 [Setaria italica]TKW10346.1 hypothetical protein SEVIR_6G158100v2 [Setaria viridis]
MAAAVVVAEGELDQVMVRAAQILVSLRSKKLRAWPKWVPMPAAEAEAEAESSPGTAPAEVPKGWAGRRPRSRGRRGSCVPWMKALRELDLAGSGGEERDAAAGSGSPSTSSADHAAPTQPRPSHADGKAAEKALAAATAVAKEPMTASSPNTPLDYGAGGSRASSSTDDAARPRAKRKGPGARGSGGEDDEGCSSPAKRPRAVADEVKPIPTSMQGETSASSAKGFAFDLNFPPPLDDGACPDAC